MQRTLSAALLQEMGATITEPLFLIELSAVSTTYRLNTWDQTINWDGHDWLPAGVTVDGLSWEGKLRRTGRITIADIGLTWWVLALSEELSARPVRIWYSYFGAPADAVPLFAGRTGGPQRDDTGNTILDLFNASADKRTPRDRIGLATGVTQLIPAGTVFYFGGVKTTLERPPQ